MNKGLKKANILDSRGRLYRPSVVWYWLVLLQLEGFSVSKIGRLSYEELAA